MFLYIFIREVSKVISVVKSYSDKISVEKRG